MKTPQDYENEIAEMLSDGDTGSRARRRLGKVLIAIGFGLWCCGCALAPHCPDGQVEVGRQVTEGRTRGSGLAVDAYGNIVAGEGGKRHKSVTLQCVPRPDTVQK